MREQQVMEHEEFELFPVVYVESDPAGDLPRDVPSFLGMAAAQPLADVVEKQSEVENLDLLRFPCELGQQRELLAELARLEPLQFLDQPERVLIDGVNMIEIVQRHAQEPAELGKQRSQHARAVHLRQRLVDPFFVFENAEEQRVDGRRALEIIVDEIQTLPDQLARLMADFDFVFLRLGKDRDQSFRVRRKDRGLRHPERSPRKEHSRADLRTCHASGSAPPPPLGGLRRLGQPVYDQRRYAADLGSFDVISAHERLDAFYLTVVFESQRLRDDLMLLERQLVLMLLRVEVKLVPDPPNEIARGLERRKIRLVEHAARREIVERSNPELHLGDPERRMDVPQSAFALFDIGLEQIHRSAVAFVAFAAFRQFFTDEAVAVFFRERILDRLVEFGVERLVAAEIARIEERGSNLHVFERHAHRVGDAARRVPDREAGVPERVEDFFRDRLHVGGDFPVIEKEQIDVGLRVQLGASVSAVRDERAARVQTRIALDVIPARGFEDAADQMIDQRCVRRHDLLPARAGAMLLEHQAPRPLDIRAHSANRIGLRPRLVQQCL